MGWGVASGFIWLRIETCSRLFASTVMKKLQYFDP
jgi:hypothetical protein